MRAKCSGDRSGWCPHEECNEGCGVCNRVAADKAQSTNEEPRCGTANVAMERGDGGAPVTCNSAAAGQDAVPGG